MKLIVTSKVDSHHTNPDYRCFLADLKGDPTFHFWFEVDWNNHDVKVTKADWMPKDKDMLELVLQWIQVSPTAWKLIMDNVKPPSYVHDFL